MPDRDPPAVPKRPVRGDAVARERLIARFLADAAAAGDDHAAVLQALTERAASLGGVACGVVLVRPDRTSAELVAVHVEDPQRLRSVRERVLGAPVGTDEAALAEVLRTGGPVFLPTPGAQRVLQYRSPGLAEHMSLHPAIGQAWVPIRRDGTIGGAIGLEHVDAARPPLDDDDLAFLEALGEGASLLLAHADARRGQREAARRSELVARFFEATEALASEGAVHRALAAFAAAAVDAEASVFRLAPRGRELVPVAVVAGDPALEAAWWETVGRARIDLEEGGVAGRAARSGEAVFVARVAADVAAAESAVRPPPASRPADRPPVSLVAAPLARGARILGAVRVARSGDAPPFTTGDLELVTNLASRAAVAVETAGARAAVGREVERAEIVASFFGDVAGAADEDEVLRSLVAHVLRAIRGGAVLYRVAEDREHLDLVVAEPPESLVARLAEPVSRRRLRMGEAISGRVALTGEPYFRPRFDPEAMAAYRASLPPDIASIVGDAMPPAAIAVPLRTGGQISGVLFASREPDDPEPFERADFTFVEALATRATVALDAVAAREAAARDAEELAGTTRTLRAILDASPVAIIAIDRGNRVRFWSQGAERLYGWTAAEVLGRDPPHFGGLDMEAILADQWRRVDAGEEQLRIESRRTNKAGVQLDVTVHLVPLRDEAGGIVGLLTVQEDVTERRRLQADLLQAQKMETVGRLAGGIAHDFNNILTAIIGYAQLGLSEAEQPAVAEALDVIAQSAERAAGLTQQLLAFSRRQMLQPTIVDVNDTVRGVLPILRRLIGEHIELEVSTSRAAGTVLVDQTQLGQVVLNLAVNARDAMPAGGRLTIATDAVRFAGESPHPNLPPGEYAVLSVSDTGLGMDEETRAHIFEPFFTTKDVGEGTGLGLATVYGIVRQSAGHIWVYSEPGSGTVFRIYLPRAGGDALAVPEPLPAAAGADEVVLLVEDDALIRGMARTILARHGFSVLEAEGPAAALELAERTPVDVLVTDVVMPGMTGVVLAQRLRERWPDLPVLLMSGYAEDVAQAAHASSAFLPKPFAPEALARSVAALLDARRRHAGG